MADLEAAKASRKCMKGWTTRYAKSIDHILRQPSVDVDELQEEVSALKGRMTVLAEAQMKVETLLTGDAAIAADQEEQETALKHYRKVLAAAAKKMREMELARSSVSAVVPDASSPSSSKEVSLVKLTLPYYDGDALRYQEFIDAYTVAVDKNQKLSEAQKLTYLRMYLTGDAASALAGWANTDDSYGPCLAFFKERFGDKEMRKDALGSRLLDFESVKDEDPKAMRRLLDTAQASIRSLETLGVKLEELGFMLKLLLLRKIPASCHKEFQRAYKKPEERTLDNLLRFLAEEVSIWERIRKAEELAKGATEPEKKRDVEGWKPRRQTVATVAQKVKECAFCDQEHASADCPLSVEDRFQRARERRLCHNCLKAGHMSFRCLGGQRCERCKGRHNKALHRASAVPKPVSASLIGQGSRPGAQRLVVVAPLTSGSVGSEAVPVRALLDDGATATFVSTSIVEACGLKRIRKERLELSTFGATSRMMDANVVELTLVTPTGQRIKASAYECPTTGVDQPKIRAQDSWLSEALVKGLKPGDALVGDRVPEEIGMVLGCDLYDRVTTGRRVLLSSGLAAIETEFGWAFRGPTAEAAAPRASVALIGAAPSRQLDSMMDKFLAAESLPCGADQGQREFDADFIDAFEGEIRFSAGRYEVPLLWEGNQRPACNERQARKQFDIQRARLEKKGKWEEYQAVFQEYRECGAIENDPDAEGEGYFLPHHAVSKESSETHRIRVVFNASAPSPNGLSLNACLQPGPNLLPHVSLTLLAWRANPHAITGDISKAFFTVAVREEDRSFLRLAWEKPVRMARVPFGASCSPFLLGAVLRHHFKKEYECGRLTFESLDCLLNGTYVDDITASFQSEEETDEFKRKVEDTLKRAGMTAHKWCRSGDTEKVGVLGLSWLPQDDVVQIAQPEFDEGVSKRDLLRDVARLFDPLGMVAPFIVVAKLLLQASWSRKVGWDQPLPSDLQERAVEWKRSAREVGEVRLKRNLSWKSAKAIHIFVDASEKAYAAVAYVEGDQEGIFLMAKSRVAPVKTVTLPRLELMAGVLGVELGQHLKKLSQWGELPVHYWTDSEIVLAWLSKEPRTWKTFVANRVAEIQRVTGRDQWRHVISKENPADLASRGTLDFVLLQEDSVWQRGPSWLGGTWPRTTSETRVTHLDEKVAAGESVAVESVAVESVTEDVGRQNPFDRISDWNRLIRVSAWILRWKFPRRGSLSYEEVRRAEERLICEIQQAAFDAEIAALLAGHQVGKKSRLRQLTPFVDQSGLLRVGGRLGNTRMSYDMKHPMILPSEHRWVRLMALSLHTRLLHAGTDTMESEWRKRFWIVGGRRLARSVRRRCVSCRRYASLPAVQHPFAPLPLDRVTLSRGFTACGVDYAGPFYIREGKTVSKVYLLLFVCAATRAVHLELVDSQSVADFLLAFRRFTGRRGMPSLIRSDNAKSFIKVSRILPLEWRLNPPLAPWWGGAYERLVRTIKTPLKKVIGRSLLRKSELETVIVEVEGVVNSRPLTGLSEDMKLPLTPAMLLGQVLTDDIPGEGLNKGQMTKRQQHLVAVSKQLRRRFIAEYVSKLAKQSRTIMDKGVLAVGQLALLETPGKPRSLWPLVKIIELRSGVDGHQRVVRLRGPGGDARGGDFWRPVQRLIPLELDLPPDRHEEPAADLHADPHQDLHVDLPPDQEDQSKSAEVLPTRGVSTRTGRRVIPPRHLKDYSK